MTQYFWFVFQSSSKSWPEATCALLSHVLVSQLVLVLFGVEHITPYATNVYLPTRKLLESRGHKTSRGYHYHHNYQCPCTDSTPSWLRGASGQLVTFTNNFLHDQVMFQIGNQNFYLFNFCTIPITRNNRWL